jgi:enolase
LALRRKPMSRIKDIKLRKILDSRGKPTVEADVLTADGFGRAAAPSGASTGKHEVVAFPENSADAAIAKFVKGYRKKLVGLDTADQKAFDAMLHEIDGTANFAGMGGNTAVAISLAVAKAEADGRKVPLFRYLGKSKGKPDLPHPFGNVLGGGKHAIGGTDIQEYLAVSFGGTFSESAFGNAAVHAALGKLLKGKAGTVGQGDEGGWVVAISNTDAMECVAEACRIAAEELDFDVRPSLDVAASSFYENGRYRYRDCDLTPEAQVDFMADLAFKFGLHSIEDPLEEDAFGDWADLTRKVGKKCLIIGDDIFVTSPERLKKGIAMRAGNAVLVKPNQIGTLTETVEVIKLAHRNGFKTVVSHRSGETTDDTIAHIAAAYGCHGIKTGTVGGERTAKLNELIRIEEM